MASYVFNSFKTAKMKGNYPLSGADDDFSIALVISAAAFSAAVGQMSDVPDSWHDLSATWDITTCADYNSTGYEQQGLSGMAVSASDANDEAQWHASNVTWASSTIDADGAVIYRTVGGQMVLAIDFGATKSSSNGDFTVQWNSEGILNLT